MDGATRAFAWELNHAAAAGAPSVQLPSGPACTRIYIVGVLTDIRDLGNGIVRGRIADPTGTLPLCAGRDSGDAADVLRSLAPPAFIAVTGSLRFDPRLPAPHLQVIPEACRVADRAERDRWLLRTADLTLSRIESIPASPLTAEMAQAVGQALAVVADTPEDEPGRSVREAVFDLIAECSGPRGVAVDIIVTRARDAGFAEGTVRDAIRSLLDDDDCYTPTPGYIKPL